MRKIEAQMLEVIQNQRDNATAGVIFAEKKMGNTVVHTHKRADGEIVTNVFLHNNLIAQKSTLSAWAYKMCGWNTPTTKSRINAIALKFDGNKVSQRKGVLFFGADRINEIDWFGKDWMK